MTTKKNAKTTTAMTKPKAETTALAKTDNFVQDDPSQTTGGGGYEFLKLVQPQTKALDTVDGLEVGDFLLGQSTKLGKEIKNLVACASRYRAVLFDRDKGEVALESFDPSSDDYSQVRAKGGDYGVEMLYWLADDGKFAAFHYGKKSSRSIGGQASEAAKRKDVVTLSSKMVSNKKGRFAVIEFDAGPTDEKLQAPTPEALAAALASFNSVKLEKSATQTGREH